MATGIRRAGEAKDLIGRARRPLATLMTRWGPEGGDAVLYGLSGLFALVTALFAGLPAYRVWAWIAFGPYLAAAAIPTLMGRHHTLHPHTPRADGESATPTDGAIAPAGAPGSGNRWGTAAWLFLVVLVGCTLAPLTAEISLRGSGTATVHVQPEVIVIDQAGFRLADGENPYHATVLHGHVQSAVAGEPKFESFFPYLPLMAVFGLASSMHEPVRVTDTRIVFSIVTLIVVGAALTLLDAPRDPKFRALQVLTVLPTAALPLATGGDDMPVVAFLLLAMVLAQRRRPGWSGVVLGVVSAMKFTAWPLAVLALFCARDRDGRRAPIRMLAGMVIVAVPVVAPFAAANLRAFFDNVILFPLGLSGVKSPAASNLPGHLLVLQFPWLHRALPAAIAVVGGVILIRHLVRSTPSTAASVLAITGWALLVAIVFAPATRFGYLLYPINFFVWGWLMRQTTDVGTATGPLIEVSTG